MELQDNFFVDALKDIGNLVETGWREKDNIVKVQDALNKTSYTDNGYRRWLDAVCIVADKNPRYYYLTKT